MLLVIAVSLPVFLSLVFTHNERVKIKLNVRHFCSRLWQERANKCLFRFYYVHYCAQDVWCWWTEIWPHYTSIKLTFIIIALFFAPRDSLILSRIRETSDITLQFCIHHGSSTYVFYKGEEHKEAIFVCLKKRRYSRGFGNLFIQTLQTPTPSAYKAVSIKIMGSIVVKSKQIKFSILPTWRRTLWEVFLTIAQDQAKGRVRRTAETTGKHIAVLMATEEL